LTSRFTVHLAERGIDVVGSLELFRRSGDDLIDRWDGSRLLRAAYVGTGRWVPFVAHARDGAFEVSASDASVRDIVANTFVPAPADYARLLEGDPVIARLNSQLPGVRQIRQLDVFTALIRCISAQQVNLRWAATTRRRLAETFGRRYDIEGDVVYALDPERLASADPTEIRALQFTTSKAVSIVATARAVVEGGLSAEELGALDDDEVIARLIRVRGIGLWSAEWVLARTLGRPRVVAGDLGVRKAIGLAYGYAAMPAETEVRQATRHWGQSAGVAQALLLHAMGERVLLTDPARQRSPAVPRA